MADVFEGELPARGHSVEERADVVVEGIGSSHPTLHHPLEELPWQESGVFGEQAEEQLVEEVRRLLGVHSSPSQAVSEPGELGRRLLGDGLDG